LLKAPTNQLLKVGLCCPVSDFGQETAFADSCFAADEDTRSRPILNNIQNTIELVALLMTPNECGG
jgi:hypothetical protein